MPASTLVHLEGSLSGRAYNADQLMGTDPIDQRPLLARYDLGVAATTLSGDGMRERQHGGLWRWRELLPVRDSSFVTHLGEGNTPLQPARRLGSWLGLSNLQVKRESLNPTGSFKARGMAVAVSRGVELGVRNFVVPSAGNAGGALAAYAAAAGVRATVVMPADAPPATQVEVLIAGAALILLDGLISDCGRLAGRFAGKTGAFDLSTLKEPYRVEGKKTMGFELVEQLGWRVPDVIVYPTGGGTGLIGMWKAYAELESVGLIDARKPRMFAVQAEGCAPIARAFKEGNRFAEPWANASTSAAGLRVPGSVGDFLILDCLRASGGSAVAVPESAIIDAQRKLGSLGLGFVSLETAAAAAGLGVLVESKLVGANELVVLFDTGAGFKSEAPADLPMPAVVPNDEDAWDHLIKQTYRSDQNN